MSRYSNIKTFKSRDGFDYRSNVIYPDILPSEEDIYIITTAEDRYDILAEQFYGDPELWWIIPTANGETKVHSLFIKPGIQLRIPANKEEIISNYEFINRSR